MSLDDARKITIIDELLSKQFTNEQAAGLLNLTIRQVQRLKAEAAANGVASILHKGRGRKPANSLAPEVGARIVDLPTSGAGDPKVESCDDRSSRTRSAAR